MRMVALGVQSGSDRQGGSVSWSVRAGDANRSAVPRSRQPPGTSFRSQSPAPSFRLLPVHARAPRQTREGRRSDLAIAREAWWVSLGAPATYAFWL
jgi:hypothetical protein